jgi:hypothetical protein
MMTWPGGHAALAAWTALDKTEPLAAPNLRLGEGQAASTRGVREAGLE